MLRSSPSARRDGAGGLRSPQPHTGPSPRAPSRQSRARPSRRREPPRPTAGLRARPRDGRGPVGTGTAAGTEAGRSSPGPGGERRGGSGRRHPTHHGDARSGLPPRRSRGERRARPAAISYLLGRSRPGAAPHYRPRLIVPPPPPPFPRCRRLAPPNCQVPPFTWARDGLLLLLLPPPFPLRYRPYANGAPPTRTDGGRPAPTTQDLSENSTLRSLRSASPRHERNRAIGGETQTKGERFTNQPMRQGDTTTARKLPGGPRAHVCAPPPPKHGEARGLQFSSAPYSRTRSGGSAEGRAATAILVGPWVGE